MKNTKWERLFLDSLGEVQISVPSSNGSGYMEFANIFNVCCFLVAVLCLSVYFITYENSIHLDWIRVIVISLITLTVGQWKRTGYSQEK